MAFSDFFRFFTKGRRSRVSQLSSLPARKSARFALVGASHQPAARTAEALCAAYHTSPYYHATIDKIADNAASVPLRLYAKYSERGSRKLEADAVLKSMTHRHKHLALKELRVQDRLESVDPEHPFYRLLRQPIPGERQFRGRTMLKLIFAWLEVTGEAFVSFTLGRDGLPNALYPVPPTWVKDLPNAETPYFRVRMPGGEEFQIAKDSMLWFKNPNLLDPYGRGLGVGNSLADELDVDESASKHLAAYFKNRAMPEMLVSIKDADEEMLLAAQTKFESHHRGEDHAYRSAFVNGAIDVKRLDTAFRDMDLVNLRKFSGRDAIVQAHGVSPEMLGILDNSNRATSFEARYMFAENVLEPRLGLVEDVLQDFASRWDDRLIVAFDSPRPEDHEFLLKGSVAHPYAMTLNEKRAILQLPPVPGGDTLPEPPTDLKVGQLPAAEDSPRDPNP